MFSMLRHRPVERVAAALDRGVLGGQPEGVEADREEHVVAVHPPERASASVGVSMYQWPMCRSPDGYGYIVSR